MLEARRSAAWEDEGSEVRAGPGWTWLSTGGAGCRRRAAAAEALVRGPILEKSLGAGRSTTHICRHHIYIIKDILCIFHK